jgi:hypothetical protein
MTELTLKQMARLGGKARWKGKSKKERKAHSLKMLEAKKLKVKQ